MNPVIGSSARAFNAEVCRIFACVAGWTPVPPMSRSVALDTIGLSSVGESKLVVMSILFGSAGRVPSVAGL